MSDLKQRQALWDLVKQAFDEGYHLGFQDGKVDYYAAGVEWKIWKNNNNIEERPSE